MWIDTQEGSEKELHLCGILNHLHGTFIFGSPLASYLALPGSESVFGLTKGPLLKFSSVVISLMNRFPLFF